MTSTVIVEQPEYLPASDWESQAHGHAVHFYEDDGYLVEGLAGFVGAALDAGDAAVVIATRDHRTLLARLLSRGSLNVNAAAAQDRYLVLDAESTLASIIVEGSPDADRFHDVVGGVIRQAALASANQHSRVAAYGEMVALLQASGQTQAAMQLEQLWNALASTYAFDLHCAYPLALFSEAKDEHSLTSICAEHAAVTPGESYTSLLSSAQQARAIALLQQKAHALETEVDQRRQIQLTLEQREADLADLLDNALEGVQEVDADQVVVWANKALLDLLGYTADEYVGHRLSAFHDDSKVFDAFWRKLTQHEDVLDFPAALKCKDGSIKHVLIHSNVRWDADRFIHTRCFLRDVTEHRRMEAALRAIEHQKEEFLAAAAHDLKTPLTSVQGLAQLLKRRLTRGGQSGAQRAPDMLDGILTATKQAVRLIDELLDVSRLDATGALDLHRSPVDLADLASRVVTEQATLTRNHRIALELSEPGPVGVWDGARLERVVGNLVSNAVRYSPDGGPITVRVGQDRTLDEVFAVLSVEDHGIGIPKADLERVFVRFQRGANVTGRIGGSGIGPGLRAGDHAAARRHFDRAQRRRAGQHLRPALASRRWCVTRASFGKSVEDDSGSRG